ncbi:MAG TPA: hypothetical protein VM260_09065, partial [Pirellula sp.]|nr:hypothetical protein [Pirellula sp.]
MVLNRHLRLPGVVLAIGLSMGVVATVEAQTAREQSSEIRFQLDLRVPDAALAAFLPSGWTPNIAT